MKPGNMKLIRLMIAVCVVAFSSYSCNDTLDNIGMGILPDEDQINTFSDTVYFDAVTVKLDSIYARTSSGMLGEYYDPNYGTLKSGYLCQFYAPPKNVFPDTVVNNAIDSVTLNLYYATWTGDSLAPMEVSIYPVINSLKSHYYSNINPIDYCDLNTVWGRQSYTARNLNITDSAYNAILANGGYKLLRVKLPVEIGYKFLTESRKPSPNAFSSIESFTDFFKGVYVRSTYGVGNILNIGYTDLFVHYKTITEGSDGADSTYTKVSVFNVTDEITQLNDFKSANDEQLLKPDSEKAYIKTPAGIFTKLIIPIPTIVERMKDKKFSSANLSLTTYNKDDWQYSLNIPSQVMLISPDSMKVFFENQLLPDNISGYAISRTYQATLSSGAYSFTNISNIIQNAVTKEPTKNLELLVVPISYKTYYTTSGYQPYATTHLLSPSAVSIKKEQKYLQLKILATDGSVN